MPTRSLSRRTFLQTATAASLSTQLRPSHGRTTETYPENGNLVPDEGWHLWLDERAQWKNDILFLPEDIHPGGPGDIARLPVNPPTGGWQVLTHDSGKQVTLPTTVEQHFWGHAFGSQPGTRPYTPEEYRYAADDPIPQNGASLGVSWWHREIEIPAAMQGKRIFLHIRGARLRAEVYLNRKLVGYSIMEELPFECDLTGAADPGGLNILAIRLTNPFGRYDWVDGLNAQWGAVKLYRSHGFAGLDRGMTISAHGSSVRIRDAWVLNKPNARSITAVIQREQLRTPNASFETVIAAQVIDPETGKMVAEKGFVVKRLIAGGLSAEQIDLTCNDIQLWDLHSPKLYHLRLEINSQEKQKDTRTIPFGFRSFAPSGLGTDAIFRLNGRRIKLYTAISWGFWGLNGLFPQAKKLNLNCLNFHRNVGKEEVFRAHDRLGLLRYMEPGGGKMAIGKLPSGVAANAASIVMEKPTDPADRFAQRYMIAKCVAMVRAFRSHPSLIQYTLQNEIGADLSNPDTTAILEAMHREDPSRCVVLNDGFVAPPRKAAQAWYEPWNDKLHRSDEEDWGGWWNQHQGAGDQWYDEFYKSPTEFTYDAPHKKVLTEFGEMEGCATPDNHSLMIHQIIETYKKYGGTSYDLADHQQILAAYDKFLDKWNFRKAFPSTESLWLSLGKKCYDTWQNYMENARISDNLDFAAISGWETTAIENHSGIVDNLRNFKSDPTPISGTLTPIRPVAKQRSMCTALGESATFDLYLLNDTGKPATGTLTFTAVTPSGKLLKLGELPAPLQAPDTFSYLLKDGFGTPPLTEEGLYRFKFALSSAPLSTQTKEIWVTSAHPFERFRALRIAVSGITPILLKQLSQQGNVVDFTPGTRYDVIVASGLTATASARQQSGDTTGLEAQPATVVGAVQTTKQLGHLDPAILDSVRAGTPLLAIPQADTLSEGVAKQLAAAGAFTYNGAVGDIRAPWMGNWCFVRQHAIYAGMPVDQAMGIHYQAKGRESNGLLIDKHPNGADIEVIAAYSRDHDRNIGAGTFTSRLGNTKLLFHRVPELHPVLQQRFLANALQWLTS